MKGRQTNFTGIFAQMIIQVAVSQEGRHAIVIVVGEVKSWRAIAIVLNAIEAD